jgi:hypothetical protein
MLAVSFTSSFTSFRIGANALHGPHHSAEKSTSTGLSELIISLNVIACVLSFNPAKEKRFLHQRNIISRKKPRMGFQN